jgi:hypothetical protein
MKKNLLNMLLTAMLMLSIAGANAQKRYIDEIFSSVDKQTNILYDSNYALNLLYGQPAPVPPSLSGNPFYMAKLRCDVYTPTGDAASNRPLILLAHTGSYLPAYVNRQTTGAKEDSAIVEMATKLAKRGYVVAAVTYRSGWNPATTIQEQATEQLIKATYRALQDLRRAVQFFRKNASTYGIDDTKIAVGGQGTGGYIAMAMATVSKRADLESNIKFLRSDATPMVNADTLGDWTGLGGIQPFNLPGNPSVSSDFSIAFNYGGAIGDTAWMKPTSKPMISSHCTRDPFAPYKTGNVVVPTTGITVIANASGGGDVIPLANATGINNSLNKYRYNDFASVRSLKVPGSANNLFGLETAYPAEGSPWEWWDTAVAGSTTFALYRGVPLPVDGRKASNDSKMTNPYMSAARARMYIDSLAAFFSPRLAAHFGLEGDAALNEFNLLSPANNASVSIKDDSTKLIVIKWAKASATVGNNYSFMFDMPNGDFSNPLVTIPVGDKDSLVITEKILFDNLTQFNIGLNQPTTLKWSVVANNNYFGRLAKTPWTITITKVAKNSSVSELNYNNKMNVYPNPASNNITVSMDRTVANISDINIFDITGKLMMNVSGVNASEKNIELSNLNKGIYIVNVVLSNGAKASSRLIVE